MPVLKPLSGSSEPPQQYSKPSRKGKKAWRKNIDVSDVQEGLDQVNKEVIQGGVIAERKSEDLFVIDVVGDTSIAKKNSLQTKKALKSDEIIAQRSAVPAVSPRKRPGDVTTDGILPVKRRRTNYVTHKELTKLRKVADGQHDNTVDVVDATYDVWGVPAEAPVVAKESQELEFVPKPVKAKAPKSFQQKALSLAASGKSVPAIPKPKGGFSYNPAFVDYEARLTAEGERAVEAERQRLADEEAERARQEAAARSAAEAEAAEARADLSEWDEDSAWEGFESGGEELSIRAKRPERKTPAQRNRVKRRKAEEGRAKHEAHLKLKREQQERIKELAKSVEEREELRALQRIELSDASSDEEGEELRRRQLGKFKLPQKDLELVLPDELQDSLRLLKPEGNLLKDRYRSLLVRGKVEARRRIPYKKQAKRKFTEKWTYKDFRLP